MTIKTCVKLNIVVFVLICGILLKKGIGEKRMNSKIDMSIPAQVCCVTDTDGTIHPKWIRFKDENEGIITIQNLEILKEHTDAIWNNFLCSALMYGQIQKFILCYNYGRHKWTIEYRANETDRKYLLE